MGENLHPTYTLLFCLFISLFPHFRCESSETKGLTLKLGIHGDTFEETSQLFNSREDLNESADHFPDTIRPLLTRRRLLFTIDVTFGTPRKQRSLLFDPGSDLVWTQCMPCTNCFNQSAPLFNPTGSSSYRRLTRAHPLAKFFTCSGNGDCSFERSYLSGQSTSGIASLETLNLPSSTNVLESVNSVAFGCMNNFQGTGFSSRLVTGILGMNRSPLSLINQIGRRRFSYCLPRLESPVQSTFLRFGNDIKEAGTNYQTTAFLRGTNDYSIKLKRISIAGSFLKLPPTAFSKGCILDPGSALTRLEMAAHLPALYSLQNYFQRFNFTKVASEPGRDGDLCYFLKPGFENYPSMTLHFDGGANLEITPRNLFRFTSDRFCLMLFGTPGLTILGAYQQQNVRFVYDVGGEKLMFANEDCSKDTAN